MSKETYYHAEDFFKTEYQWRRKYLISVKRDLISVKRDLISVKRDLISVKRDLISVKTEYQGVANTASSRGLGFSV